MALLSYRQFFASTSALLFLLSMIPVSSANVLSQAARQDILPECMPKQLDFSGYPRGRAIRSGVDWNITTFRGSLTTLGIEVNMDDKDKLDVSAAFDSAYPSKDDEDLGSPNESCGGPGKGFGGRKGEPGENCAPLGKILIANKDDVTQLRMECKKACSDEVSALCREACQPNDYAFGATFIVQFDKKVKSVMEVVMLDAGDPKGITIQIGDRDEMYVRGNGNNSVTKIETVDGELENGDKLIVRCMGSCALVTVKYSECMMGRLPGTPETETPEPEPSLVTVSPQPINTEQGTGPSFPDFGTDFAEF